MPDGRPPLLDGMEVEVKSGDLVIYGAPRDLQEYIESLAVITDFYEPDYDELATMEFTIVYVATNEEEKLRAHYVGGPVHWEQYPDGPPEKYVHDDIVKVSPQPGE